MAIAPAQRAKKGKGFGTVIVALQQTQYDSASSLRIFAKIDSVMQLLAEEMALDQTVIPEEEPQPRPADPEPEEVFTELPYAAADGRYDPCARMRLDHCVGHQARPRIIG